MAEYVTDRTEEDVLEKNRKGHYTAEDLNRVENAVKEISEKAESLAVYLNLTTKTDWSEDTLYSPNTWITAAQMERYIQNVRKLADAVGVSRSGVPSTMAQLNYKKANAIEKALQRAETKIDSVLQSINYRGEIYAGEGYGR